MTVTTVLALATWGSVTTNRHDLISVSLPNVTKASTSVLQSHVIVANIIALTFANVNMAYFMLCHPRWQRQFRRCYHTKLCQWKQDFNWQYP
jgi:hypothetical protein